jgi:hypothetical protein
MIATWYEERWAAWQVLAQRTFEVFQRLAAPTKSADAGSLVVWKFGTHPHADRNGHCVMNHSWPTHCGVRDDGQAVCYVGSALYLVVVTVI